MVIYNQQEEIRNREDNKMSKAEEKARFIISLRSTENLVKDFEGTETNNDPDIYIVRGWLMDELEARDSKAFEAWIDSYDASPRKYFVA
jgi:hypothetical protein